MNNLVVGQKIILKRKMLGEQVGSIGFVVDEYPDFDLENGTGVMIIFSNGGYDGFSEKEQDLFLEILEVDPRFSMYEFENVLKLEKDYRNGFWKFYE